MKPFSSPDEMLDAHEKMFGLAGRQCAEEVCRWARTLFAEPLEALNIRIVLAPVELGPYNKSNGYHYGDGDGTFILGNRNVVRLGRDGLELLGGGKGHQGWEDFIVHELTHARQIQLEKQHEGEKGWRRTRGVHRCRSWYTAVSEACPKYLGFELPPTLWPTGSRTRKGTLTEVEMTHWPRSLRALWWGQDTRIVTHQLVSKDARSLDA
jgi:hypothetical protein